MPYKETDLCTKWIKLVTVGSVYLTVVSNNKLLFTINNTSCKRRCGHMNTAYYKWDTYYLQLMWNLLLLLNNISKSVIIICMTCTYFIYSINLNRAIFYGTLYYIKIIIISCFTKILLLILKDRHIIHEITYSSMF